MAQDFTPYQYEILEIMQTVASGLSLGGTLFIMITYKLVPSIRTYSMKLVLSLIFADFLFAVANIMSYFREYELSCNIEGFIRTFSVVSSAIWAATISYTSYLQTKRYDPTLPKKYPWLLAINIVISLLPTIG